MILKVARHREEARFLYRLAKECPIARNMGYQNSSTNIDIARSSREITKESHEENGTMRSLAELCRRDNELMIQIAKNSREVAVAAAQDSAAMIAETKGRYIAS